MYQQIVGRCNIHGVIVGTVQVIIVQVLEQHCVLCLVRRTQKLHHQVLIFGALSSGQLVLITCGRLVGETGRFEFGSNGSGVATNVST
jgi:hypothetical protein